jgi:tRNA (cytidine32/uridine32-2'-O)-methyltransferase
MTLDQLRIVLVHPSHPGNIGAAARAMKTMGLETLYLVKPKSFPDGKAVAMASGADDILSRAVVVETFEEAINNCHFVIGTTARDRTLKWPTVSPKEAASTVMSMPSNQKIAILFGCEQWGLTNEQLSSCHLRISIPTRKDFSSLNLAAAVQIISYELYVGYLTKEHLQVDEVLEPLADAKQVQSFYQRLEYLLKAIDFSNIHRSKLLIRRVKRLFNRVQLEEVEVNILQGILTALYKRLGLKP